MRFFGVATALCGAMLAFGSSAAQAAPSPAKIFKLTKLAQRLAAGEVWGIQQGALYAFLMES
ncbi:MAG TPA: hypothetical protein VL358_06100 [Caulobacteraceae bacterium]|jgi:hypothetical protein|nr:hypothetical protein [Caulobacteraceae bacterium]